MYFTLVAAGPHHIRYLATADEQGPDGGTIQFSGAGDADVALYDAVVAGPLKEIIGSTVNLAAEASRLLMDDGLGMGDPDITDGLGRAVTTVIKRDGNPGEWAVDALPDGNGHVRVVVLSAHDAPTSRAYVEILFRHSFTQK